MTEKRYDLIIIGSGPAGITASIYASRYKLSNLVIGKQLGGELINAHKIENYPGFLSVSGIELAQKMGEQVEKLGAKLIYEEVGRIEKIDGGFKVEIAGGVSYESKALIVASGSERRRLGVAGEQELIGKGVSYCTTCLPAEEEIVANSSLTKIGEIGITQRVLTENGTYQSIKEIMARNYKGEMITVKTRFFTEPVKLTANHPVLTTTVKRKYYAKEIVLEKPRWRRADELTKDDVLIYPIVRQVQDKKNIKFSEILGVRTVNGKAINRQETRSSLRVNNEIPLSGKFLRLAGYYLAEGCATRHGINFYFSKYERELVKDVKELIQSIFSLRPLVKTEGGVRRICLYSKLIRDLFEVLFGKLARHKKIPHWLLFLPAEKQIEIVRGVWRGDGCVRDKDFCLATTSRTLAYQMRDLLLRLGVIPSLVKCREDKLNKLPSTIGRRKIRFNGDKYHLTIGGPSLERMSEILDIYHPKLSKRKYVCRHAWMDGKFLYLPVREIEKKAFKGKVFNLAIEANNTYVAKNFIVHNCDAPFYRDKVVGVIGGSDAAVTGAIHAAEFAAKIYLIYRGEQLRAEPTWLEELKKLIVKEKVMVIYKTNVIEILSKYQISNIKYQKHKSNIKNEDTDGLVGGVKLDNQHEGSDLLELDGLFIEIGGVPGTALVKELGVTLNEGGYIQVGEDMSTNVPGLFCAGDMVDRSQVLPQAITAMAQGAMAASSVYKFLKGNQAPRILGI